MDNLSILYVSTAFFFHSILIVHFSLRKWRFITAIRYGYIIYALGILFALSSLFILLVFCRNYVCDKYLPECNLTPSRDETN